MSPLPRHDGCPDPTHNKAVWATPWIEGSDRAQAIAALDGSAPAWMGRFASFGTPIAVNITSGIVGSRFVFSVLLFT